MRFRYLSYPVFCLWLAGCQLPAPSMQGGGLPTHRITAASGSGGVVYPAGDVFVTAGGERAFVITPDSGHRIVAVYVDGVSIGDKPSVVFREVSANHTLSARFEPVTTVGSAIAPPVAPRVLPQTTVRSLPTTVKSSLPAAKLVADGGPQPLPRHQAKANTSMTESRALSASPAKQEEQESDTEAESANTPAVESVPPAAPEITPLDRLVTAGMAPGDKGRAIVIEADRRDTGYSDQQADMIMTLTNRSGDEVNRYISYKSMEADGDGDRSLILFDRPADIKGTALLTYSHQLDDDDQWLYLPAIKRVKRISSSNQSGSFVGSEFAYEDLSSQEVEKFSYEWIRDDVVNGRPVFVVNAYPKNSKSGYRRQERWIDQGTLRLQRVRFYDRKNELLKTQEHKDYRQYLGRYWRASLIVMSNHQTGKETRLVWENYRFQTGLAGSDFSRAGLKRARN